MEAIREGGLKACRYGARCHRVGCSFAHPNGSRGEGHVEHSEYRRSHNESHHHSNPNHLQFQPTFCRYDVKCMRPDCHFFHPNGRSIDSSLPAPKHHQPRPCRYGANCYLETCRFSHPMAKVERRMFRSQGFVPQHPRIRRPRIRYLSRESYVAKDLKEQEAKGYKAAGALPYRRDEDNKVWVLLGLEQRNRSDATLYLNLLGGMRERKDKDAQETAVREFWEESGGLLDDKVFHDIVNTLRTSQKRQVFWVALGKYALFAYEMNHDIDINERYNRLPLEERFTDCSTVDSLHWVLLSDLLGSVKQQKDHLTTESGATYNLYSFLSLVLGDANAAMLAPLAL